MKRFLPLAVAMLITLPAWAQDQVVGLWLTEAGESLVEVFKASDGTYGGRVVWLREPKDSNGEDLRDVMNGTPRLRSRKVLGIDVLRGYRHDDGIWRSGTIYNWRSGNSYNSKMYLEDGRLHVKGYYSLLFFLGRTKVWTRVTDLNRYGLR